ncbi:MAG TPA: ABC transporter substrate-binding protein [Iamia sp.]|nr:ABC transporter substrate-binding protein [Iamia sp.]
MCPSSLLRRAAALLVVVIGLAGLGGCSGSGEDDGAATTTDGVADSFAPVTIEHRFGETEITTRPERIVTLDLQWTDVLLTLDAAPVGYLADPAVDGDHPWQEDRLASSTRLTATTALPLEQIIDLRPDLILVTYLAEDQAAYDDLARIAPTISTLSTSQVDTWQDIAGAAGQVLGEPEEAAQLVADVEAQVEAVAGALPDLEGRDFTFANYVPGDALYVLSDPEDGANVLFGDLGLVIAPAILDAEDDSPGRVKLSLEQTSLLDADLVMVLTNGADDIAGLDDLDAVQRGAFAVMDYAQAVALNTPTPLSLPYVLDQIRPVLEIAAT